MTAHSMTMHEIKVLIGEIKSDAQGALQKLLGERASAYVCRVTAVFSSDLGSLKSPNTFMFNPSHNTMDDYNQDDSSDYEDDEDNDHYYQSAKKSYPNTVVDNVEVQVAYFQHIGDPQTLRTRVCLGFHNVNLPYVCGDQRWPKETFNGAPFCAENMPFSKAMAWLERGKKVRLRYWDASKFVRYERKHRKEPELVMYSFCQKKKRIKIKPFVIRHEFMHSREWEMIGDADE